jgi:lipoyl(octanoyl) transferase
LDKQPVLFEDLGVIPYQEAWDYQEGLLKKNVTFKISARAQTPPPDPISTLTEHHLLFCEHPPVYTLGKSGHMSNILISEKEMEKLGISFYRSNRGGDITFHGPGQIVGYPIFDLEKFYTDIGRYLRNIEEAVIQTLQHYGIMAGRSAGETGVWIDADKPGSERKICAIGVRCSRWITMHGFAFNINTGLDYFSHIIPCGIADKKVTSLEVELGRNVEMEEVKTNLKKSFEEVFSIRLI